MGDVLSLIEKAEEAIDESEAEKLEEKIRKGGFSLEDFRDQLKTLRKMGPLEHILGMLPGMGNLKQLADQKPDERQLRRIEAIIGSMTPEERKHAEIIDGSRRKRIARGSGTSVEDVNRLLKQFNEMQRMLKMVGTDDRADHRRAAEEEEEKGPVQSDAVSGAVFRPAAKARSADWHGTEGKGKEMLSIRMRRTGSKKRPFYRVVVAEGRDPREGSVPRDSRHLQPADQAGDGRDRSRAREPLDQEGRAAVGFGAHAAGAAPDEGSQRRGAGAGDGRRRPRRRRHRSAVADLKGLVEAIATRAGRRTGCGSRRRERAPRHDGDRTAGRAGRPRPRDRPAGPDGRRRADAAGDGRRRRRQEGDARYPGRRRAAERGAEGTK